MTWWNVKNVKSGFIGSVCELHRHHENTNYGIAENVLINIVVASCILVYYYKLF